MSKSADDVNRLAETTYTVGGFVVVVVFVIVVDVI